MIFLFPLHSKLCPLICEMCSEGKKTVYHVQHFIAKLNHSSRIHFGCFLRGPSVLTLAWNPATDTEKIHDRVILRDYFILLVYI